MYLSNYCSPQVVLSSMTPKVETLRPPQDCKDRHDSICFNKIKIIREKVLSVHSLTVIDTALT